MKEKREWSLDLALTRWSVSLSDATDNALIHNKEIAHHYFHLSGQAHSSSSNWQKMTHKFWPVHHKDKIGFGFFFWNKNRVFRFSIL
jgi:hypothetical protein